jgi:hypothetical protein
MDIRILNSGFMRKGTTHSAPPTRLQGAVGRGQRSATYVEGVLMLFIFLAILTIWIAHTPTETASFQQLWNEIIGLIHIKSRIENTINGSFGGISSNFGH